MLHKYALRVGSRPTLSDTRLLCRNLSFRLSPSQTTSISSRILRMSTTTHPSLQVVSTKSESCRSFVCYRATRSLPRRESLKIITGAAGAVGPYCQAIKAQGLLFVSGNLGFDPIKMQLVEGGVGPQTEQALKNLQAVVEDGGSSLGQVIKTTVCGQHPAMVLVDLAKLLMSSSGPVAVLKVHGRFCYRERNLRQILWFPYSREVDGRGRTSAEGRPV